MRIEYQEKEIKFADGTIISLRKPKYSIVKSIHVTIDWYKRVLLDEKSVEKTTEKQINEYMNESQ